MMTYGGSTSTYNTFYVNGVQATRIGQGAGATPSAVNLQNYTIICTAPNQYSYYWWATPL